jgi:hypothetical protein
MGIEHLVVVGPRSGSAWADMFLVGWVGVKTVGDGNPKTSSGAEEFQAKGCGLQALRFREVFPHMF